MMGATVTATPKVLWSLVKNFKLGIEGYIVTISGSIAVRDGFAEPIYSGFKTTDGFHTDPLSILEFLNVIIVRRDAE